MVPGPFAFVLSNIASDIIPHLTIPQHKFIIPDISHESRPTICFIIPITSVCLSMCLITETSQRKMRKSNEYQVCTNDSSMINDKIHFRSNFHFFCGINALSDTITPPRKCSMHMIKERYMITMTYANNPFISLVVLHSSFFIFRKPCLAPLATLPPKKQQKK